MVRKSNASEKVDNHIFYKPFMSHSKMYFEACKWSTEYKHFNNNSLSTHLNFYALSRLAFMKMDGVDYNILNSEGKKQQRKSARIFNFV